MSIRNEVGFKKPIYVTKSYLPPLEEYIEKLKTVWSSHQLTNYGVLHQELEAALKAYLKCNNLLLYCNGHLALDVAIKTLKLKGEVITTPFTFVSTANAITMNNLKPVFCDIRSDNFTIDADKIEPLITKETSAILPVHVYGMPCDVNKISKIAKKYNLKVIYDAAHAFGVKKDDREIGIFGDITMFSFHATKIYHTIEGGALSINDNALITELELIRNFGISGLENCELFGLNAKMNEMQAAMGLCNLNHIEECIRARKKVFEIYINELSNIEEISCISIPDNVKWNYSYFPILVGDDFSLNRDDLHAKLSSMNIITRKYFYPLVTQYNAYKEYNRVKLPIASNIAKTVLCLPMDPSMDEDSVSRIAACIKDCKV